MLFRTNVDGDYLAWSTAQWDIFQNVAVYDQNVCSTNKEESILFMKKMPFWKHKLNCGILGGKIWTPQDANDLKSLINNYPNILRDCCSNNQQEIFVGHKAELKEEGRNEVHNWYTGDLLYPAGWDDNISSYPWVDDESEKRFLELSDSSYDVTITLSLTKPLKFDFKVANYESCAACQVTRNIPLVRRDIQILHSCELGPNFSIYFLFNFLTFLQTLNWCFMTSVRSISPEASYDM